VRTEEFVNPNRNGWSFWTVTVTVTATGKLLQSIR
jgi:hypothetical protein